MNVYPGGKQQLKHQDNYQMDKNSKLTVECAKKIHQVLQ